MQGSVFFNYFITAVASTLINLLVQRTVLANLPNSENITMALVLGTLAGLVSKFFLDKEITFKDHTKRKKDISLKFLAYSALGVLTTLIFWGFEFYFWVTWKTETMREIGAIIGLSIGYLIKFFLDKQYIFTSRHEK